LPPEIGKLTNLTLLTVAGNQLTALPPEIGTLTNLTELDLFDNPQLIRLIGRVNPYDNQLTTLPPEIGKLTKLTTLSLGGNQLTALPPEMANLTNLTEVMLSRCERLGRSDILVLSRLPELKQLNIIECPQLKLPEEVVETNNPHRIAKAIEES